MRHNAPLSVAICCVAIILALVVGVGLASKLVLWHIVQTAPFWVGVALGFRRSRMTSWAALPSFLFWLTLMTLIWSYLLCMSHILSGHFSGVEVGRTIIVGLASIMGIASFIVDKSYVSLAENLSLFLVMAGIQWICFRISF